MAWRNARSIDVLSDEIWEISPDATIWTIGDQDHAARYSDHNPNPAGVVCAADIVDNSDLDLHVISRQLTADPHPALKYVIYNRQICTRSSGWDWRGYDGDNPHDHHMHVSVGRGTDGYSTGPYDDTSPWGLAEGADMSIVRLKIGDSGDRVEALQGMLDDAGFPVKVDSDYGPKTAAALLACRKAMGSSATSGDYVSGHAYRQLHKALILAMIKEHGGGEPGPAGPRGPAGPPGELPLDGVAAVVTFKAE